MSVTRHLAFAALALRRHRVVALVGAIFALGFTVGTLLRPLSPPQSATSFETAHAATGDVESMTPVNTNLRKFDVQTMYPAEVVRVIDGDTFQARVQVWPGLSVDTKVRLRNIDAPELHARCADELKKAEAARAALDMILAAGGVTISRVGIDKYGGRVDALVATRDTADVSTALLNGGWARSYDGGRRGSWC